MLATSSEQKASIQCRNLQVRFEDGSLGLANFTTDFAPGEITAIIGPSGCGKSTLLRAIAGLVPHGGQVDCPRSSHDLSFVFQDPALVPWRTALENVRLPFELTRSQKEKDWTPAVSRQLDAVELDTADQAKLPEQLSGGMRMRVSLARALVTDPGILLLDEPFAALDEMLRTRLGELLVSLWQQRPRTVLFVTHNISEAILLSHHLVILSEGELVEKVANPLPFPRDAGVRTSPDFAKFYTEVAAVLTEVST